MSSSGGRVDHGLGPISGDRQLEITHVVERGQRQLSGSCLVPSAKEGFRRGDVKRIALSGLRVLATAPIEHIRIDAGPGGAFETLIVSDADGSTYATRFLEVEELERLVWREASTGMTVQLALTSLPEGRTEFHIVPASVRLPETSALHGWR